MSRRDCGVRSHSRPGSECSMQFALDLFSAPNNSPHLTAVRLFLRFLCKEHGTLGGPNAQCREPIVSALVFTSRPSQPQQGTILCPAGGAVRMSEEQAYWGLFGSPLPSLSADRQQFHRHNGLGGTITIGHGLSHARGPSLQQNSHAFENNGFAGKQYSSPTSYLNLASRIKASVSFVRYMLPEKICV